MTESSGAAAGNSFELVDGVPVTLLTPAGGATRGMVVVQEAFGVTEHVVDICRRLTDHGFAAAAPHLHHRVADPAPVAADFAQARPLMDSWTGDGIRQDLVAAITALRDAGCEDFGVIGFCAGGSIALWAAATLPFSAAVTYYGGGLTVGRWPGVPAGLESAEQLRTPWLGVYGDLDGSIPTDEVAELSAVLAANAVPSDVLQYPEAGHAFHNDTRPDHYHAASARDAWAHTIAWLDAHLHGPSVQGTSVSSTG